MLLHKHHVFRATDRAELDHLLRTMASGRLREAQPIPAGAGFRCNAFASSKLPLFSLSCDVPVVFDFDAFDAIRLVFRTDGNSRIAFGSQTIDIGADNRNYILPAGEPASESHPDGYGSLAVRVRPSDLSAKLEALCDCEVQQDIVFSQPDPSDDQYHRFVRQPLMQAARELDVCDAAFHATLIEDIKELTLTRLLLFARHNHSDRLTSQTQAPSHLQLRLAENFLAKNWNKPLDIIGLSTATGVSARTILRYFRARYGKTPRDYLRRLRLDRARQMLTRGDESTTVVSVALTCGFNSLGHFAAAYREQFGELPSVTLRTAHPAQR